MKRETVLVLIAILSAITAVSAFERISGGNIASISTYKFAASLAQNRLGIGVFQFACGGSIISSRAVLTAAYCMYKEQPERWRIRVGSATASTGGRIHTMDYFVIHPHYNPVTKDNDIAILHVFPHFSFTASVSFGSLAPANYMYAYNQTVTAIGWGALNYGGAVSESLRQVQLGIVENRDCRSRYYEVDGPKVTNNMVCAIGNDITGKGQCLGDNGSPLLDGELIIGFYSWSYQCGTVQYPGVNTFIPNYINWIQANY